MESKHYKTTSGQEAEKTLIYLKDLFLNSPDMKNQNLEK
jgi:hypothetical protein